MIEERSTVVGWSIGLCTDRYEFLSVLFTMHRFSCLVIAPAEPTAMRTLLARNQRCSDFYTYICIYGTCIQVGYSFLSLQPSMTKLIKFSDGLPGKTIIIFTLRFISIAYTEYSNHLGFISRLILTIIFFLLLFLSHSIHAVYNGLLISISSSFARNYYVAVNARVV